MCGYGIDDGRKLQVDHKTPVDLGGTNDEDNLWTTCSDCNQGKKNLFDDSRADDVAQIMELSSLETIVRFFELYPNKATMYSHWLQSAGLVTGKERSAMSAKWIKHRVGRKSWDLYEYHLTSMMLVSINAISSIRE